MTLGEAEVQARSEPFDALREFYGTFIDTLYEQGISDGGRPLEFRQFDREVCSGQDSSWLYEQIKEAGISKEQFDRIIGSEIIPKMSDHDGNVGYVLYAPEQLKTVKELQDSGRYTDLELRHIVDKWNEKIEWSLEVVPYDELGGVEFETYRKHVDREIDELQRHIRVWSETSGSDATIQQLEMQLANWGKISEWMKRYEGATPPERVKERVSRSLFRLRFVNELVRTSDACTFRGAVMQGFSPEVVFSQFQTGFGGSDFRAIRINWRSTFSEFQRSRTSGGEFPLRTPEFDVTQEGLRFRDILKPQQYEDIYQRYQLEDLQAEMQKLGPDLWHPSGLPPNTMTCPECNAAFPRTVPTRRYCSDKCRSRAKQRRWREADPERARQAQARYWSNTYSGEDQRK